MNNFGGKIKEAGVWQKVLDADSSRAEVIIQNTSLGLPGYDREGVHDGPALEVWPFSTVPTTSDGASTGAALCRRAGDAMRFAGTGSQGTFYVRGKAAATFAAITQ